MWITCEQKYGDNFAYAFEKNEKNREQKAVTCQLPLQTFNQRRE